jgi:hypothetical protein
VIRHSTIAQLMPIILSLKRGHADSVREKD